MKYNKDFIYSLLKRPKEWSSIEYFDTSWEKRVRLMSEYISKGKSVLDLGCGKMYLRKYIPSHLYIPVDYKTRGEGCQVCDFNKYEYPAVKTDIAFISGCLEYIKPYKWFISSICSHSSQVIISYCTTNYFPNKKERKSLTWKNHLSESSLIEQFIKNDFRLIHGTLTEFNNNIFVFARNEK